MPLSDFVRYINAQHSAFFAGADASPPFVAEGRSVVARFSGLQLESGFRAVVSTLTGETHGHAARLSIKQIDDGTKLKPESLFTRPCASEEFITLDRLVRTLHALNYLHYPSRSAAGTLLLKVHPRHIASVAKDHGLAFEGILRSCGLQPAQIVLAFDTARESEKSHFFRAVGSYRRRGYGIAINRPGPESLDDGLIEATTPEIVILRSPEEARHLDLDRVRRSGALVMASGPDDARQKNTAAHAGIDLWQVEPGLPKHPHRQRIAAFLKRAGNRLSKPTN